MTVSLINFLTIVVNMITVVTCTALAMLILWQDVRRRSNQLFALAMGLFGVYSATDLVFRFNYLLRYPIEFILYFNTTLYGWGSVVLFIFLTYFARVSQRFLRVLTVSGLLLIIGLTGLLWTGLFFTNLTTGPDQIVTFNLTWEGMAALAALVAYHCFGVFVLWSSRTPRSKRLWLVAALFPLDSLLSAIPFVQNLPLESFMMLIVGLVVAHAVMREHVWTPLDELNQSLAATNAKLEQANQFKSQFLANMSHELRTPLNSIIGYTDLVTSGIYGPLTDKQSDRLDKVARNGRRLLALINDVLDLSRIEAGRMVLNREPVTVADALNPVLSLVKAQAEAKNLKLECEYAPDVPQVQADSGRLEQILLNVLSNAVKFTETGGVSVRVYPEQREVIMCIADTGMGIPLERQEKIFETFREGEFAASSDGTGLGLALTRHLVQMHGGRIWLTSEGIPGKGTSVYVSMPIAEGFQAIRPTTGLIGPIILYIDDTLESVDVVHGMLDTEGYRVYGSGSGPAGLRRVRELHPDLILLDITMPGMDGWQVVDALRADPQTARIPVIMVSSADQSALAKSYGTAGSLQKPFKRDELLSQVNNALQAVRT